MVLRGRVLVVASVALVLSVANCGVLGITDADASVHVVDLSSLGSESHASTVASTVASKTASDDSSAGAAVSTKGLHRHSLNPWYYKQWGRWRKLPVTPARKQWTKRGGRWYRSPVSNYYWLSGRWQLEKPGPHASDPSVWRIAGRWVKKPNRYIGATWVKRRGKWWKSNNSNMYYSHGKWKLSVRLHPSNPTLVWRGGQWIGRKLKGGARRWTKRYGRWWICAHCHTYYRRGRWVRERSAWKANNPFYRRNRYGRFVRRRFLASKAQAKKTGKKHIKPKYQRQGKVYWRSPTSLFYFHNGRWFRADPRSNDPRWRSRFSRPCGSWSKSKMIKCRKSKWYLLPKHLWKSSKGLPWVKVGSKWWADKRRLHYWHRGRWVSAGAKARARIRLQRQRDMLKASGAPIDLRKRTVDKATNKELGKFLNWFLGKYVTTEEKLKNRRKELRKFTPEPGPNTKFNPEPDYGKASKIAQRVHSDAPGNIAPALRFPGDEDVDRNPAPLDSGLVRENSLAAKGENMGTGAREDTYVQPVPQGAVADSS